MWLGGYAEWSYDGGCYAFQETARDGRCCRVPSRSQSRASEQYGRWSCVEAVTRGYYPVETIVELYITATLGGTTAMFMYLQGSMSYGDGVVGISWRGRVERVAMVWTWRRWCAAMVCGDGYKHMFFGDLVSGRLGDLVTWRVGDLARGRWTRWRVCYPPGWFVD